jgi:hypothetical protein
MEVAAVRAALQEVHICFEKDAEHSGSLSPSADLQYRAGRIGSR